MNNARFEDALTDVAKVYADPKDCCGNGSSTCVKIWSHPKKT
jgi:hypothetical protein